MAGVVERQRARAVVRRGVLLPEDLTPAIRFDPRLPGWTPCVEPVGLRLPSMADGPLPADPADIAFASARQQAAWVRTGAVTSDDLLAVHLTRVSRWDPVLRAFPVVSPVSGAASGPLCGVPYGCKDLIDTAGIETAWGAEVFRGRVPREDATVVQRLAAAGAVMLGKTSVGALADGDVWYGGQTRSPWDVSCGSSGSSAGTAAAVAAGLIAFGLGTENHGLDHVALCAMWRDRAAADLRAGFARGGHDAVLESGQGGRDCPRRRRLRCGVRHAARGRRRRSGGDRHAVRLGFRARDRGAADRLVSGRLCRSVSARPSSRGSGTACRQRRRRGGPGTCQAGRAV